MSMVVLDWARATDDQLRVECERRGMYVADEETAVAVKKHAHGTYALSRILSGQLLPFDNVMLERDEWKRRAEAARSQPTEVYAVVQNDWVVAAHELSGKQDGVMLTHERDKAKVFLSSKMIGRIINAAGADTVPAVIDTWTGDRFHLPLETPEQFAAMRKLLLAQFKNEPAAARALQSDASEVGRASGWRTRKGPVPKLTKAQLAEANARIEAMARAIPK